MSSERDCHNESEALKIQRTEFLSFLFRQPGQGLPIFSHNLLAPDGPCGRHRAHPARRGFPWNTSPRKTI
jgi:hypothetical protein